MDTPRIIEIIVVVLEAISIWLTRTNFFAIKAAKKKVDQVPDYLAAIEAVDEKVDTLIAAMKWGIANTEASRAYKDNPDGNDLPPSMRIDE